MFIGFASASRNIAAPHRFNWLARRNRPAICEIALQASDVGAGRERMVGAPRVHVERAGARPASGDPKLMANGEPEGPHAIFAQATAVEPLPARRSVRTTYHRLRMVGLTATEAGNLTAHLNGLRIADQSWTLHEIERLLFVRALVERGRIPS
jgi:hypothetical protein